MSPICPACGAELEAEVILSVTEASPKKRPWRRWVLALAVVLLVVAACLVVSYWR